MYIPNTKQFYLDEIKHTLENTKALEYILHLPEGMWLGKGRHSGQYVCTYIRRDKPLLTTYGPTGKEAVMKMKELLALEKDKGVV